MMGAHSTTKPKFSWLNFIIRKCWNVSIFRNPRNPQWKLIGTSVHFITILFRIFLGSEKVLKSSDADSFISGEMLVPRPTKPKCQSHVVWISASGFILLRNSRRIFWSVGGQCGCQSEGYGRPGFGSRVTRIRLLETNRKSDFWI